MLAVRPGSTRINSARASALDSTSSRSSSNLGKRWNEGGKKSTPEIKSSIFLPILQSWCPPDVFRINVDTMGKTPNQGTKVSKQSTRVFGTSKRRCSVAIHKLEVV